MKVVTRTIRSPQNLLGVRHGEVGPFHPEIVDGNGDLAEPHLFGEILHKRQAGATSVPLTSTIIPSKAG
jgi:hypothetical protein